MPILTFSLSDTTFISSAQPDMNLSFYPLIYVGTDPSYRNCIGLINVTLPQLPVSRVDSALLQLSVIVKSGANPRPVVVNQVTSPFISQKVTYNTRPDFTATASQTDVTASNLYTSIQIDVTELVNSWLDGSADNDGIALTNSDGLSVVQFGTNNIIYEPYFPKMVLIYSNTPTPTGVPYGRVYHTGDQQIAADAYVPFGYNGPLNQITHQEGSGLITVGQAGLYTAWFTVGGQTANQFALYQNEAILLDSNYGTASGGNNGMATINAAVGDVVSLRNCTESAVTLNNTAGGTEIAVSASIFLMKIGSNVTPDLALAGVNAAQNSAQMNAAITAPALGLNLVEYNAFTSDLQQYVCSGLLVSRPTLGYLTVSGVQQMLNYYVALAPTYIVDPNNIQVKAGATSGNGSIANPFGDIQQGIDAVNSGGTVHVQSGNYQVSSTINLNKTGVTLSGQQGSMITTISDYMDVMRVTGSGSRVQGLTLTSNEISPIFFFSIQANDVTVQNNTIYEPPQASFINNQAIVIDLNTTGLQILNNTIYSFNFGIYISAGSGGTISGNIIYESNYGISIDNAQCTITNNSWNHGHNASSDILLQRDAPLTYDAQQLSVANDNASVMDMR